MTKEIEALAARDERARRLMTVPGIGPLGATALLASAGDAQQFKKARDMAAWLGLVPRQHSVSGSISFECGCNKVTIALAAKLARIAWVILTKPGALYERRDPTAA